MKQYTVIVEFRQNRNRKDELTVWANDKEQAVKLAVKWLRIDADMVDIIVI